MTPELEAAYSTELEAARISAIESDYIESNLISSKFQEYDRLCWSAKWFDYRHMTNLQATHLYMEEYAKIYKQIYAREFDRNRAEYVQVADLEKILGILRPDSQLLYHLPDAQKSKRIAQTKKVFVGYWRGRQVADMLGMPYSVYINNAMSYRLRAWKRGHMPQSYQLYSLIDVEKTAARWEEIQATRLYVAEHSAYLVQNYQGLPQQNAHHEWLFKQAKLRSNPAEMIARFITNDLLPLDKVLSRDDLPPWETIESYLQ